MPRGFGLAEDNLQPSPAQLPVGGHAVWYTAGSGLYRRYRRWANVNAALVECLVLGVFYHWNDHALD